MPNAGKRFETQLKSSMELAGFTVHRIQDGMYWDGRRMASNQTPADFYAWLAGERLHSLMVEAKASSSKRLDYSRLAEHQLESLVRFDGMHQDAHGYIAANFYDSDNVRNMNRCYMVPVGAWVEHMESGERKSLSMGECEEDDRVLFCPRIRGSMYDMTPLRLQLNS